MALASEHPAEDWDEWAGLPKVGTRVRVPYPGTPLEGEVVLHYRLFGELVARVCARVPDTSEYGYHELKLTFEPQGMEIVPD